MAQLHSPQTSGIYIIVNTKNNKIYIGQSKNISQRWKNHQRDLRGKRHNNTYLQRAWDKYGENFFNFKVLEYCPVENLDEREQHYLDIYMPKGVCYNVAKSAAFTTRGLKLSDEVRARMSASHRGKPSGMLGKNASAETLAKMSAARKGKKLPPRSAEHSAKIAAANKLRGSPSIETRQKISEAGKRRAPASEETRAKLSKALKGRISPTLGMPTSDETKRKLSEAAKGRTHSEETRLKMSESQKRRLAKKQEKLSHSGS